MDSCIMKNDKIPSPRCTKIYRELMAHTSHKDIHMYRLQEQQISFRNYIPCIEHDVNINTPSSN